MDDLRGTPMSVGTLEEIIDDNHAIVSTSVGSEHYVSILSFVDKDLLEPGCSVLLNHKVRLRVGCSPSVCPVSWSRRRSTPEGSPRAGRLPWPLGVRGGEPPDPAADSLPSLRCTR